MICCPVCLSGPQFTFGSRCRCGRLGFSTSGLGSQVWSFSPSLDGFGHRRVVVQVWDGELVEIEEDGMQLLSRLDDEPVDAWIGRLCDIALADAVLQS